MDLQDNCVQEAFCISRGTKNLGLIHLNVVFELFLDLYGIGFLCFHCIWKDELLCAVFIMYLLI